jgi:hypothetical protein
MQESCWSSYRRTRLTSNPIEEYFGVLKKFIKKKWHENEDFILREFQMFSEWCADVVGDDERIAESHFRHAGISVTQPLE